jgi:hypothetical protein
VADPLHSQPPLRPQHSQEIEAEAAAQTPPVLLSGGERPARGPSLLPWYLALLGGLLPVLLLGFLYSALADRLAFAGWALLLAACYTVALRQGMAAGWPAARLAGAMALVLAAGTAALSHLESVHHEMLDLGFRAVLPALYTGAATSPRTAAAAAAALGAGGLAVLAASLLSRRSRR